MLSNIKLQVFLTTVLILYTGASYAKEYYEGVLEKIVINDADIISMNGGEQVRYNKLVLAQPTQVTAKNEENKLEKIDHVDGFQINTMGENFTIKYSVPVRITCADLYTAHSMYHYTDVICELKSIEYIDYEMDQRLRKLHN